MNSSLGDSLLPSIQRILDVSPMAIVVSRIDDGVVIQANEAFLRLHGYSREEVIGHTSSELQFWANDQERASMIATLQADGHSRNFAHEYRCKSGRTGRALCSATVIEINGRPHLMGFISDAKDLDDERQSLINSERTAESVFANMLNGMAYCRMLYEGEVAQDFIYLKVNNAFESQTGLRDVIGRRVSEVIPGIRQSDPQLFEIYGRVARSGKHEAFETYVSALQAWFSISVFCPEPDHFVAVFEVITERKRMLEDLLVSKAKLEAGLASMSDAMFLSDTQGNLVDFNAAFARFYKFSSKQECPRLLSDYPAYFEFRFENGTLASLSQWPVARALRGERATGVEYHLRRKDTGETWVGSYSFGPIRASDGHITGSVVTARDVTLQKHSEMALKDANHRLALAQQAANAGFWDWDMVSGEIYWSPEFFQLMGFDPSKVQASTELWTTALHPEDKPMALERLALAVSERKQLRSRYRIIRPDGELRVIDTVGDTLFADDGSALRMSGICIDITDSERSLTTVGLYETIFQHASWGMVVADPATDRITHVNQAYAAMHGYTIDELLGSHFLALYDPQVREQVQSESLTVHQKGHHRFESVHLRKDGSNFPSACDATAFRDANNKLLFRASVVEDITEKKQAGELIWRQANFDALTQLPNRRMFHEHMEQEIRKLRHSGSRLALLLIDLDHFKEVNDTLGHVQGDVMLVEAARRIMGCARGNNTVARLGGDEFTVLLTEFEDIETIDRVAQDILHQMTLPFHMGDDVSVISASIGITMYPNDSGNINELFKHADQAMYVAKRQGRNRFSYFTPSLQEEAQKRLKTVNDLRSAVPEQQLRVYFQPIVDLKTQAIHKAEALVRWEHPQRGLVSPAEFIPLAEETGLIHEIGNWVFRESARWAKYWSTLTGSEFQVSVNKSPVQFTGDIAQDDWLDFLEQINLPGSCIAVEITEGVLVDTESPVVARLQAYREGGIQVSIDDFGTGYSSLAYLKKFHIDYLKIDQSFTKNLAPGSSDLALSEAIIVMAHKLGLKVVAEGVETQAQCDLLIAAGCDYGQGYLFARPSPPQIFQQLLKL